MLRTLSVVVALCGALAAETAAVKLKPHDTTRVRLGQMAVLQIPSEREYERQYRESASSAEQISLPTISKRRYAVTLDDATLRPVAANSCVRSRGSNRSGMQAWSCKPSGRLFFRARRGERTTFLVVPTDGNPRSRHCVDCVTWHYFVEVTR